MAWSGDNAREIANLTKLKRLGIGVSYEDYDDEEERDHFNFNFLSHLVHLEGCNVSIDRPEKISKEMLCKCLPPSLKYLTLSMDLDLGLLTHLTNLENFANKREVINLHQLAALSKMTYLILFQHNIEQDVRSVEKLTQLIQLNFFSWQKQDLDENGIDNLPDLSGLINLKNLRWQNESEISQEKIDNFKYLTGLEELILGTGEESTIDCDFLGSLTNLTALTLDVLTENLECISNLTNLTVLAVNTNNQNQDSFWCGVTALTKLEILRLLYVDNDNRLLGLTALNNLTNLAILKAGDNFMGVHFTALTTLHSIFCEPEPDPDEHNNSDDEEYLNVMKNYKPSILQFT